MSQRRNVAAIGLALTLWLAVPHAQSIVVPNQFVNGTVADATQVNANFAALSAGALNRTGGTMTGTLTSLAIVPTSNGASDIGTTGTRYKDAYFSGSVYDQGQTTGQGIWIPVTYAGGNFAALGGGSWTVESGDQITFKYMRIGKTVWVAVVLDTTTVAGTVTSLTVAMPGGLTAAVKTGLGCVIYDNSATVPGAGLASINLSGSLIVVLKGDGTNFAASTNLTYVRFVFAIEVT